MPTTSFRDLDTKIRERFKETANQCYTGNLCWTMHGGEKSRMNDDEDLDVHDDNKGNLCAFCYFEKTDVNEFQYNTLLVLLDLDNSHQEMSKQFLGYSFGPSRNTLLSVLFW